MKTSYIIDTNTFSYIASGRSNSARTEFRRLSEDHDSRLCISVLTEAEVRYDMQKRGFSAARSAAIEGLLANFDSLPWGSDEAAIYARALPLLQAQGLGVSLFDLLIGVSAAANNSVLVTHDKNFSRIAETLGIAAIVDWAQDVKHN